MIFRYRSPLGTFVIAPQERGFFELLFGEETLERYRTPDEAALRVYRRATGCSVWDSYEATVDAPESLEQWERWQVNQH